MTVSEVIEAVGVGLDVVGVAAVVGGIAVSALKALSTAGLHAGYKGFRQNVGRSILLGLELLVAADIVRTVALTPTLESVGILAGIVAIRTFLSMTLEIELEGQLPWRRSNKG